MKVPDLLNHEPCGLSPDLPLERPLHEALTFAFARGVDRERLLSLAQPRVAQSNFEKQSFCDDLFLGELVQKCFPLVARERKLDSPSHYFKELLSSPPTQLRDIELRASILKELGEDKQRREWVENAYLSLRDFSEALCGSDHFNQRSVGVRRRIDVLIALRRALDVLAKAVGTSKTQLASIALWVEQLQQKDSYRSLVQLLDFEDGRSVLETRLQAGYDGTLRRFEIVGVSEAGHQAFPRGAFSRFMRSLLSLLRGYRFSEEDVMSHVLDHVFSGLEFEVAVLLGLMQQLEFYLRALQFEKLAEEQGLATCQAQWCEDVGDRELKALFNPWLAGQKDCKVVPCDLKQSAAINIVTGPNSGGKTRVLQSLAVAQLLAQVGLPVPARVARLKWVDQLFLSLIEHAKPDQDEGRLGLELLRIRRVFETSGKNSLILMDELCSGTNPSEGERIFEMVLDLLTELGAEVWISTHFLDFAARIQKRQLSSVDFLQVELDSAELPTYQFVTGVADTSLARNTAARLGVTREELHQLIHPDRVRPT